MLKRMDEFVQIIFVTVLLVNIVLNKPMLREDKDEIFEKNPIKDDTTNVINNPREPHEEICKKKNGETR